MNKTLGSLALGAGLLALASRGASAQTTEKSPPPVAGSLGTGSTAKAAPGGSGSTMGNGGAYTGADSTGSGGAPTGNGQTGTSAPGAERKKP